MTKYYSVEELKKSGMLLEGGRSKSQQRLYLIAALIVCDGFAIVSGFLFARFVRFGTLVPSGYQPLLGAFAPIFVICALMLGAYRSDVLLNLRHSLGRSLGAISLATGILLLILFYLKLGQSVSRGHFSLALAYSVLFVSFLRQSCTIYAARVLKGGLWHVLEIRDGYYGEAKASHDTLYSDSFFDPHNPSPASLDLLARYVGGADRIVIRCAQSDRSAWSHVFQGMNVAAELVFEELNTVSVLGASSFAGETTLVVARGPLGLRERAAKRTFDIAFALIMLVAAMPLMLLTALAIKLESPGPILFRQPRIGRQNRLFHVYKFRSMRSDACDAKGARSTSRNDPRVTRVGAFIRRYSIDEFPQFLNVLAGDMSIVGPRPHATNSTAEARLFWEVDERYWHRHACRPGVTGLAQISGLRGTTERQEDLINRVDADLHYIQNWSFWGDIRIIVRTAFAVFSKDAY